MRLIQDAFAVAKVVVVLSVGIVARAIAANKDGVASIHDGI